LYQSKKLDSLPEGSDFDQLLDRYADLPAQNLNSPKEKVWEI
jgi:hypothetical protein